MRVSRAIALHRPEQSSLRILRNEDGVAAAAASRVDRAAREITPLIQMAHNKSTVILKETMNGAQSSHFFDAIIY